MADITPDSWLDHVSDGYVWTAGLPTAALFLADTWTPSKDDAVMNDAIFAGAIEVAAASYARVSVPSPTKVLDGGGHRVLFDSSVIDFGTLENGSDFDTLVIFEDVTDDSDSWLIHLYDLGAQVTDDSGPTRFVPDGDGLFQLSAFDTGS